MYRQMREEASAKAVKTAQTDMSNLSKDQRDKLLKHSAHHSPKHINLMVRHMRGGESFDSAHKLAMREAGK